MIDLHSHLLPGVDDGSRSVDQSVAVLTRLGEAGVTDVCLTPHLTVSRAIHGVPPSHDQAFAQLQRAAPPQPRLHRGVELMLDRPVAATSLGSGIRLAGSRYVLVEFPRIVPGDTVLNALRQVVAAGAVPVLAHPERYSSCTVRAAKAWKQAGALLQLDAMTILASSRRGDRARALLGAGLADLLAADNHGDSASLAPARQALEAAGHAEQARLLTETNPRAILDDRSPDIVEPVALKPAFAWRLRRLLDGGDE